MKRFLIAMLASAVMLAAAAGGHAAETVRYMVTGLIAPIMKAPGAEWSVAPMADGQSSFEFDWSKFKDDVYPLGAVVYGNVVDVKKMQAGAYRDSWAILPDPEGGDDLGYIPFASLTKLPEHTEIDPVDLMAAADDIDLRLVPDGEPETHLSRFGMRVLKGEVVTAVARTADQKWMLLRFATNAGDADYGSGLGERYAWARTDQLAAIDSIDSGRVDEALLPSLFRHGGETGIAGLSDEILAGIRKKGFFIGAPVIPDWISYDDMGERYAQTGRYTPQFITSDIMFHTYHKIFSNFLRDTERSVFVPRLASALEGALASLDAASLPQSLERPAAVARDMLTLPLCLLGRLDASALSDAARQEAARIESAEGVSESLITGQREDYSQYKPRGHYASEQALSRYFRAMNFLGSAGLQLVDGENVSRDAAASASLLILALGASDEWRAFDPPIDCLMGRPDDGSFADFDAALGEHLTSFADAAKLADEDVVDRIARTMIDRVSGPKIRDRKTGGISKEEEMASRGLEFRISGKRFNFDAYIYNSLTSPRVGTDDAPRNLPEVADAMSVLGSPAADEITSAIDVPGYAKALAEMKAERSDHIGSPQTAYEMWLRALSMSFTPSGSDQFFYRSPEWRWKELATASASYAELKHDTVLYAKQSGAEMGDGGEPYAGPFAPPLPRGYVEPSPEAFAGISDACAQLADLIARFRLEWDTEVSYGAVAYTSILERLAELSEKCRRIATAEAKGERILAADYEEIIEIAGAFESWLFLPIGAEYIEDDDEKKMAIVSDIATDFMGGRVLHVGVGTPSPIWVYAADRSGGARVMRGWVLNFYEFARAHSEGRMTDAEWRKIVYDASRSDELEGMRPSWHGRLTDAR